MFAKTNRFRSMALMMLLCLWLTALCSAAEIPYDAQYNYQETDFSTSSLDGIFITEVPASSIARIQYGSRTLRAGDVLPASALSTLSLQPVCLDGADAVLTYLPVSSGAIQPLSTVSVTIGKKGNEAPMAEDQKFQTYKNIANSGQLTATDPENDALTFTLITSPKRGEVSIAEDGTFTYTPTKNKVGTDRFTFVATDTAGNVSNEATVSVEILKPTSKQTYADMVDDPDAFSAKFLQEQGVFTGERVSGQPCFNPEKSVTRGEFLCMLMDLLELKQDDETTLTSGFADEAETPAWMRPYVVAALSDGIISGVNSDDGLVFRPTAALTHAEAAVMIQNILDLPAAQTTADDSEVTPVWAENAVSALSEAGILAPAVNAMSPVTRREASRMLYSVWALKPDYHYGLLAWAAE